MPFSAMSPPPRGSDDAEVTSLNTIWGRTPLANKSSEEDTGRCEGYDKARTMYHAGVFLRMLCSANKQKERLGIRCIHCATLNLLYSCVKLSVSINLISYGLHNPGGTGIQENASSG